MPFCISRQGFQTNTRIRMAELQKWLCKLLSLLEIAHLGEIDVFFCLNVMLKMSSLGIRPWLGFLWTMSGKCLWSLNCLTRLNLCNVFSSQSQNLCVFNWCYGFTKHCSVLHHHLSFCHRPNRSYTVCLRPPIHLLTGQFWFLSVCVCVCSVRWSLSGQKTFCLFS